LKAFAAEVLTGAEQKEAEREAAEEAEALRALLYASPILPTRLALLVKIIALVGGAVLVLLSWEEMPPGHAGDYHGCLLVVVAGMCLVGAANDLVTLFLALELVSIPTYVLLYLSRVDAPAQEAAMKYFLLSVFSSALLVFGFSFLYGTPGATNLPGLASALGGERDYLLQAQRLLGDAPLPAPRWQGVTVVALVMVLAGLGFRITAVPFHFYAPDVYQGTTSALAAVLAFV